MFFVYSLTFPLEYKKLGSPTLGLFFIQLSNFPSHYLVLVIRDDEFRYALISVETLPETKYSDLIMKDIGWLDVRRIHGEDAVVSAAGHDRREQKTNREGVDNISSLRSR